LIRKQSKEKQNEAKRKQKHSSQMKLNFAFGRTASIEIKQHDQTSKANIKVCSTAAATVSNIPNKKKTKIN